MTAIEMTLALLGGVALGAAIVAYDYFEERRVRLENDRRRREWETDCKIAKVGGFPPPCPPNRVRRG